MIKKYFLLFFILASQFVPNCAAQNVFLSDSLEAYVKREMQRWNLPGLALAVVKDGNIVVMKGFGVRDMASPKKVTENTLFQVASNTKAFTGTCLALLHFEKRLSLDDKVTKWIPDFRLYDSFATQDATVRDMLCHRIGFRTFQSDFLNWNCNLSRAELIQNMRNVKPELGFRSRYGYCNMGFVVAGEVIKRTTDSTWEDHVEARLLEPLQMKRTFTSWKTMERDTNVAAAHTLVPSYSKGKVTDSLIKIPRANVENIGPSASFNSTVKDLANWLLMQLDTGMFEGSRIVPEGVIRETWRSQMLVGDPSDPVFPMKNISTYGLGWQIIAYAGRKVILHGGGTNGMVTRTMFVPQERLGIVVLTNSDANSLYDMLAMQILESYLDMPYRNLSLRSYEDNFTMSFNEKSEFKDWKDIVAQKPRPAVPLFGYVGKFRNEVYGNIEIKQEKGKLKIYFAHHPKCFGWLEPMGGNDFLCTYTDVTWGVKRITFAVDNQKAQSVTIKVNDFIDFMPYEFRRVN